MSNDKVTLFQIEELKEQLRPKFEALYCSKEGERLDSTRLPHGAYRSMITHYAFHAYCTAHADLMFSEEFAVVPFEPKEHQWSGLARHLMMWLDFSEKSVKNLYKHLNMLGTSIPKWLKEESELSDVDSPTVPSKGTRVTLIYKAMVQDHRDALREEAYKRMKSAGK